MLLRCLFDVRVVAACLAAFLVLPLAGARAENEDVWALLKKPGTIVLLRHSYSPDFPEVEPKFGDCSTQRNLDESDARRPAGSAMNSASTASTPQLLWRASIAAQSKPRS